MRCKKCNGSKVYQGLGSIKVECPVCLGVGHVKDEVKPEMTTEVVKEVVTEKPKVRRKRATTRVKAK